MTWWALFPAHAFRQREWEPENMAFAVACGFLDERASVTRHLQDMRVACFGVWCKTYSLKFIKVPKFIMNFGTLLCCCGTHEKTHGLSQKIQAMYFKIQGTYFKIYALYFLPLQMLDKQQLKRKYIKGGKCVSIKFVWKICAFLFRMAGKGCFTKTVCNKKGAWQIV